MNKEDQSQRHSSGEPSESPQPPVEGLAGYALDRAVAERVMGWYQQTDYDFKPPQVDWYEQGRWKGHVNCDGQLAGLRLWSPSTDISAAMEVVEKMRADGWKVEISDDNCQAAATWFVSFFKTTATHFEIHDGDTNSLPESICRAALAAAAHNAPAQEMGTTTNP